MFKHWPLCVISPRSSCFMYKGILSLYTPNIIAFHDTCIGLRKSFGIIKVIYYMGSSSGSSLSTGFFDFFDTCLSYTVNKHKLMIVKTLFWSNPFLITINTTKRKYIFFKRVYKFFWPCNKGIQGLPHRINLFNRYRDMNISISNFFNTHIHHIIGQTNVVYDWWPLINSPKGKQAERNAINIQPIPIWDISVRVLPWGINININTTFLWTHMGIRKSYIWLN